MKRGRSVQERERDVGGRFARSRGRGGDPLDSNRNAYAIPSGSDTRKIYRRAQGRGIFLYPSCKTRKDCSRCGTGSRHSTGVHSSGRRTTSTGRRSPVATPSSTLTGAASRSRHRALTVTTPLTHYVFPIPRPNTSPYFSKNAGIVSFSNIPSFLLSPTFKERYDKGACVSE